MFREPTTVARAGLGLAEPNAAGCAGGALGGGAGSGPVEVDPGDRFVLETPGGGETAESGWRANS